MFVCVRCASSDMQMMFARSDRRLMSSLNFWIVVRNTPPLLRPLSFWPSSSRVSTLTTVSSPINCFALTNWPDNWSSKSVLSVINTIVGLARCLLFINNLVRNSIVRLLPQPVAPKYVPPLPSPWRFMCECSRMFSYRRCAAKNWGYRHTIFNSLFDVSGKYTKSFITLSKRSLRNSPCIIVCSESIPSPALSVRSTFRHA